VPHQHHVEQVATALLPSGLRPGERPRQERRMFAQVSFLGIEALA
jgi:hypothetical protein